MTSPGSRRQSVRLSVEFILGTFVVVAAAQEASEVQKAGPGVTLPHVVKEVKPEYTEGAKKARIQGTVVVEAVVKTDGTVGDVKVTRLLDTEYGLDEQAVKAARQWLFEPGKKDGQAVPVSVAIELTFTLK
jgi:protein TonB